MITITVLTRQQLQFGAQERERTEFMNLVSIQCRARDVIGTLWRHDLCASPHPERAVVVVVCWPCFGAPGRADTHQHLTVGVVRLDECLKVMAHRTYRLR